jgi:hypothetical protein
MVTLPLGNLPQYSAGNWTPNRLATQIAVRIQRQTRLVNLRNSILQFNLLISGEKMDYGNVTDSFPAGVPSPPQIP